MVVKLETERLILRKPKLSDAEEIFEGIGNKDVSRRLSSVPYPYKKSDAEWWLKRSIKRWMEKEQKNYDFIIILKSERKIIGSLGIHDVDRDNGVCSTGSWLNKNYWRKGYMTEAKIALNEFAFNKLKIRRMETGAFTDNKASNATQLAVGYKYEGCRRKKHISKATGKLHDENMYGLLKEDWKKKLPKLKKHLKTKIKKLGKK
ncbi:GNAT family N-acetyltransferase [archaeon]|nr:GNAT family N-acetyltransferase [archaeon]